MLSAFRTTLGFLSRREKVAYWALVILRSLTGLLDVVGIALIGLIAAAAARLASPGTPLKIAGFVVPNLSASGLLVLVAIVLAVFLVKASTAIFLTWRLTHFIANLESDNAHLIANYLLRGSLENIKRYSKAEFQYAIAASTTYAFTGILNNIATFCSEGFLLVVVAGTFFVVNPVAAVFSLLYFGMILVLIQLVISRSLKRAGRDAVEGLVSTASAVSDTVDTFREISVLYKQGAFIEKIRIARSRISRSDATMTFLAGMPRYVVETALILGVMIFVAEQFLSGGLATSLGTIGVFLTGGVRMIGSLLPLQAAAGAQKQNVEQAKFAQQLILEAREARAVEGADVAQDPSAVERIPTESGLPVRLSRTSYRYAGDKRDTLHSVTLDIAAGEHVAIIGPSGAGKTTLVDLMLGLILPNSGTVKIAGIEPNALRQLRPGAVAYVPQRPGMVSGSIAENIALGVEPEDIDHELLEKVVVDSYLKDFVDSLPEGLNTSVGKQVDALSGGQIQRIGLARALYACPQLLILDEATSGLDAGSEAYVSESLHNMHGKVTVVVIAHRLSTVQHADLVHVLDGGVVIASDKFKRLQATVPMVAQYVKLMSFDES